MIYLLILSWIVTAVAVYLTVISVRKSLASLDRMEELGLQVEESLDMIDESFRRLSKTAEHPVLSDEPIVRQLLKDVKFARVSLLQVANKLVSFDTPDAGAGDPKEKDGTEQG